MKQFFTFLLAICSIWATAQNQINPITITLPANPPANTAEWATALPPVMILAQAKMQNGQVNPMVVESKILVTIKNGAGKICGMYNQQNAPMSNFNAASKNWTGANVLSLLGQECTLQPGSYELCVKFISPNMASGNAILGEACKAFTIVDSKQQVYSAPQNISPANEKVFNANDQNAPITFRWVPVLPKPKDPVTYRLKVWQLMQGQSGSQAMRSNPPIVTKDVDNITQAVVANIYTGPCRPPYLCDYVWNVQALDKDSKPIGNNNGTSELSRFSYGTSATAAACCPGTWGAIQTGTTTSLGTTLIPWSLLPSMPSGSTFYMNTCYTCGAGCGTPSIAYQLYNGITNLPVGPLVTDPTGCSTVPYILPTGLSTSIGYVFKITAYCGGVVCDSSKFQFSPSSPATSTCCTGSSWGAMQWCIGTPCVFGPMPPCNGTLGSLTAGSSINFNVAFNCAPGCVPAQIFYNIYNNTGSLFSSTTGTSGVTTSVTLPTTPGNYSFTLYGVCGGTICDSCKYQFIVFSCCTGSSWGAMQWCTTGTPCTITPMPPCNSTLGTLNAGSNANFNVTFNCGSPALCSSAQILFNIYNSSGSLFSSTPGASATNTAVTLPTIPGSYTLTIYGICGGVRCDSCKYQFTIASCCAGSSWGVNFWGNNTSTSIALPSSPGSLGAISSAATKYFKVFFNCAPGCATGQIIYQVYNSSGVAVPGSSGSGLSGSVVSIVFPSTPGSYFMKIFGQCGGQNCDSLIYKFIITPCCPGGSFYNTFYRRSGPPFSWFIWKPFSCPAGSALLPMHLSSVTNIKACFKCPAGCGVPSIKYTVTGPGGYVWTSGMMPGTCSTVNAIMPPTIGAATLTIDGYCNGILCNTCVQKLKIIP